MLGRLLFVLVLVPALACGPRRGPEHPAARALYRDLQRLVTIAEAAEWTIDRHETRALLDDALMSVCQVPAPARQELASWLEDRIRLGGGLVTEAYRRRHRSLDAIDSLLELTRVQMVLRAADEASTSDCPFWLSPRDDFRGRQISDDRWQLSVGGGGRGNLLVQGDQHDVSFGGSGRLLVGRATGERWTIFGGIEMGGQASFPKDADGNRGNVVLDLELAVPVVARYRLINSYVEAETGYLMTFAERDLASAAGFRVGLAVGARALLTRWFFPGAAFHVAYDHLGEAAEVPAQHIVRIGVQVAFDLNL